MGCRVAVCTWVARMAWVHAHGLTSRTKALLGGMAGYRDAVLCATAVPACGSLIAIPTVHLSCCCGDDTLYHMHRTNPKQSFVVCASTMSRMMQRTNDTAIGDKLSAPAGKGPRPRNTQARCMCRYIQTITVIWLLVAVIVIVWPAVVCLDSDICSD